MSGLKESLFCCSVVATLLSSKMVRKVYDKDSEAFYCCCGCMHVKTGTAIICVLQILYIVILTVLACWSVHWKLSTLTIVFLVFISLVLIIVYVTPFIGLCTKTAGWLWPYIIVSIINLVISFGLLVASFVGLCLGPDDMNLIIAINAYSFEKPNPLVEKTACYYWLAFYAAKNLSFLICGSSFLMVVWSCKSYLRDLENDKILSTSKMTTLNETSKMATINENQTSNLQATTDLQTDDEAEKDKKNGKSKEKKKDKEKEKPKKEDKKKKKKDTKDEGSEE